MKKITKILIFSSILIAAFFALYLNKKIIPNSAYDTSQKDKTLYLVKNGDTYEGIAQDLYHKHYIRDISAFLEKQSELNTGTNLQAQENLIQGNYAISPSMNTTELVKAFQKVNSKKSKELFFESIYPIAQKAGQENTIFTSLIMAHAALESNYGVSELAYKYNNYFGIKASKDQKKINLPTKEIENGQEVTKNADFRYFDSMQESFLTYAQLLSKPQFKDVANADNSINAAKNLYKDHYATDPQLGDKIVAIIKAFNLQKYDK